MNVSIYLYIDTFCETIENGKVISSPREWARKIITVLCSVSEFTMSFIIAVGCNIAQTFLTQTYGKNKRVLFTSLYIIYYLRLQLQVIC